MVVKKEKVGYGGEGGNRKWWISWLRTI